MNERAKRTMLMKAYVNLVSGHDTLIESINCVLLKEELEDVMDCELTDDEFHDILKENAKVYSVKLIKYRPNTDYDYLILGGIRIGAISMAPNGSSVDGIDYI